MPAAGREGRQLVVYAVVKDVVDNSPERPVGDRLGS